MLMGKKLMGVFSLLVLQRSQVLLEWGLATWATPKPPNIDLKESNYLLGKKGLSNQFAYNAASDSPRAAEFALVCVFLYVCVYEVYI